MEQQASPPVASGLSKYSMQALGGMPQINWTDIFQRLMGMMQPQADLGSLMQPAIPQLGPVVPPQAPASVGPAKAPVAAPGVPAPATPMMSAPGMGLFDQLLDRNNPLLASPAIMPYMSGFGTGMGASGLGVGSGLGAAAGAAGQGWGSF